MTEAFHWSGTTCSGAVLGQLCPLPFSDRCSTSPLPWFPILPLTCSWLWDSIPPLPCSVWHLSNFVGMEWRDRFFEGFQVLKACVVCDNLDLQHQPRTSCYVGIAVMSVISPSLCSFGKWVLCSHPFIFYSTHIYWIPDTGKALC